ncbi:MAG TPA: hypothetical protein VNK92_00780 [Vicinamibacterales bacterium]|nr:hypothetical protein [Vicinamibacterales bacterium]
MQDAPDRRARQVERRGRRGGRASSARRDARPWPWIVVALCTLVLYPGGALNPETGQPDPAFGDIRVMTDDLPSGFRGLLLASFAAAYMSTIATQMSWGASHSVNDFYRRSVRRDGTAAGGDRGRGRPGACRSAPADSRRDGRRRALVTVERVLRYAAGPRDAVPAG